MVSATEARIHFGELMRHAADGSVLGAFGRVRGRAQLGVLYAHLYGLTCDEVAHTLDTLASASFSTSPIVRWKDKERWGVQDEEVGVGGDED